MSIRKSAFAAVRWTSLAMLGRACIALVQIMVLSRILNPPDFKLVAIAVTIVNFGIVFTDMGINSALIRFRDITSDELSSLFWLNVTLGSAMTIVTAAASPLLAWFYGDKRLTSLFLIASLVFLVSALGQQQRALAEKKLQFDLLFLIDISSASVGFIVAVVMALLNFGATSIVVGNLVNVASTTILSWTVLAGSWRPSLTFSKQAAKRFISFGSNVVGTSIFNAVALNADVMLGGRFIPGTAVGYYFQPRDICMRIMFVVNPIVTRVSFPLLSSLSHDRSRVRSIYVKAMNMTASINFPIYGFLAVFAPEVTAIMLGPKWAASAPIMRVLALWCAVRSVGNPIGSLLFAMGETRRAFVSAFAVAFAVIVFVALGAQFNVIGIAWALTLLYVILIPVFWIGLVKPSCDAGFAEYHVALLRPAAATLCATVAGGLVLPLLDSVFVRLILAGSAAGLVYLAVSWIINRDWLASMAELLMVGPLLRRSFKSA